MRGLPRRIRATSDGLRSSRSVQEAVSPDCQLRNADFATPSRCRNSQMRHRVRQLSPGAHTGPQWTGGASRLARLIAIPHPQACTLAGGRPCPCSPSRRAMPGLWWTLSAVCHGLRSPPSRGQAIGGYATHRSGRSGPDLGRGGKVRYRLCELSPVPDLSPSCRTCGSSSVGRARPFQGRCRGFEPRLPLQHCLTTDPGH